MKKIANLLLTLLFIASFSISVFAADVTEVNDTEGPTISSDAWNCIEQKIENKKAEALSILEAMPLTVSANGIDYSSYSSDELLNMYAHIVKEQIMNNGKSENSGELEKIDLALNSKGTIFLTDEDMQQLFPATTSSKRSANAGYPEPGDTRHNTWSATQSLTYDGYDCVFMSAFPKTDDSSLYYEENNREVFEAKHKDFLNAVIEHFWGKIEDAAYDYVGVGTLADLFGIFDTESSSPTTYSVDIITSMRAKFCWVYYDEMDSYIPMGAAHTIDEDVNHEYDNAMLGRDQELKNYTRSTGNFTNIGLARKAVQQLESRGPSYPYAEYFRSSGFEYEFAGGGDDGTVYYMPPYAIYPSDVT